MYSVSGPLENGIILGISFQRRGLEKIKVEHDNKILTKS